MKKVLMATMLLLATTIAFAQQPADKIIGTWESVEAKERLRFEIYKSNGKYFGKLIWAYNMYEADGKTIKKDNNNPNKSLRDRPRKGIVNITNLKYDGGEYVDGNLYNPANGSDYSLKAKLKDANNLEFRGYMGVSLLGKTMKFKRIK